jgi:hypothetical protein
MVAFGDGRLTTRLSEPTRDVEVAGVRARTANELKGGLRVAPPNSEPLFVMMTYLEATHHGQG